MGRDEWEVRGRNNEKDEDGRNKKGWKERD